MRRELVRHVTRTASAPGRPPLPPRGRPPLPPRGRLPLPPRRPQVPAGSPRRASWPELLLALPPEYSCTLLVQATWAREADLEGLAAPWRAARLPSSCCIDRGQDLARKSSARSWKKYRMCSSALRTLHRKFWVPSEYFIFRRDSGGNICEY